ncbi:ribose operon repressor [Halalkalibacter wakoensis JCM 9140]|uniref:Ribose operon repressor n=1 Tax=Halalkalibacter wakoensis JCM 9140 TaxID=1236970 RepID=W4Q210_9BACI|nr:LacI family DNA-binding transcriptional regulator [Halalkalibacter wakoensis]GAE25970.1 ribose operon repressor [Halalkalibacter wakoensis JCM 9140]
MKVTISDVAKKAGVSKTTVSRILNGNYSQTTDETRKRVQEAIKSLDYSPNALAKGLKSTRTNVLGIVLANLKNPFWTTVLEGVEDTSREMGYNLMICNSNEDEEYELKHIKELRMRQVDGIVLHPTVKNTEMYRKLLEENYPVVFINRRVPYLNGHSVVMDNIKGATIAVNHLLKNGRKKVAAILYKNPYVSTWSERIEGYKGALREKGYTDNDFCVLELVEGEKNCEVITRFFEQNKDIDAIFSTNNMLTLEVQAVLKEMKIKVPEDVAIVSYDETKWAKFIEPPLTTISQPGYEMGELATQILIKEIQSEKKPIPSTIVLNPELIVRQSAGEGLKNI